MSRLVTGLRLAAAVFLLCLLVATAFGMMASTAPRKLAPQATSVHLQPGEPLAISGGMAGRRNREAAHR